MNDKNYSEMRYDPMSETDAVIKRYALRTASGCHQKYSFLNPEVFLSFQERQRVIAKYLASYSPASLDDLQILEIGCGNGSNLLELLRMGCRARNLIGNELLPERLSSARSNLPLATQLIAGDASLLEFDSKGFDIVYQSTVFSSLLDDAFQDRLARKMWSWLRPGGAVLWYDFIYNNPSNLDVRGVSLDRIHQLFPDSRMHVTRVTLAPPISRRACRLHPGFYSVLNATPWLRTHVLCWLQKI